MKNLSSILLSTALAGLVVLLPLAILFLVGVEVYGLLEETAAFARLQLPFPPVINALILIAGLLAAVFLVCLLAGLSLRTRVGRNAAKFIERQIADRIPLLGLLRNLTLNLSNAESELKAAEADLYGTGACVLCFLMETLPDGRLVVFVPAAPAATIGSVYILPADRVRILATSVASVANAVTQWGVGTAAVYPQASNSPEN